MIKCVSEKILRKLVKQVCDQTGHISNGRPFFHDFLLIYFSFYFKHVEVLQKKFDDFKGDMKANESRLQDMNQIATALTAIGQTETAVRIQQQLDDLNTRWRVLEEKADRREQQLGSAHEVQRFHRDVDETRDWIQEKNEALDSEDFGRDLRSVQANFLTFFFK